MARIQSMHKGLLAVLAVMLMPPLSVLAQQSPLWQGPRVHQPTTPTPPQAAHPSPMPQESLPPTTQSPGEGHPQVMEMPAAQAPSPVADQPILSPQQPADVASPTHIPTRPPYLGIAGNTAPACRYPAGVRVRRVIEGSPAHQAGLKGEGTLSWKQAVAGVLAMSPAALFVYPFLSSGEHGGHGDLILAVDGKRIHDRTEFEQEMGRFRPGDVVYFSVLRGESGLRQIPVHLTDYPDTTPETQAASVTPVVPGS
jgi:hypothetical protein